MTVPPSIEKPRTVIGVSYRDALIVLVGILVAGLIIFMIPGPFFIRIAFATLIAGLCFGIAFGREPKSGKTAEQFILDFVRFAYRPRYHRKGSSGAGFNPYENQARYEKATSKHEAQSGQVSKPRNPDLYNSTAIPGISYQPISLGVSFFFSLFSVSFLVGFCLWLWFGGAVELSTALEVFRPF